MNEGPKPFACDGEGCDMTFTNEDHLNWHRKKHDMVLNLGLANKNSEVADQTPTPTRFIRNCEEVGLFQDLQNVNPFDEFFKKAVEITKSGGTLEVHEINSEDTLHTPHILPHIEECQKKVTSTVIIDENSHSNEFTLNNVIPVTENCDQKEQTINEPIIEIHEHSTKDSKAESNSSANIGSHNDVLMKDVKLKIKQTLQIRGKQKKSSPNNLNNNTVSNNTINRTTSHDFSNRSSSPGCKEKIRAMNRAAQVRCRKRKAQKWKEMEAKLDFFKNENKRLKIENAFLKRQLLIKNKETENNIEVPAIPVPNISLPSEMPVQDTGSNTSNSIVIKILPNSSVLPVIPVNIITNQACTCESTSDMEPDSTSKPKKLRKIVPKIVIDKC